MSAMHLHLGSMRSCFRSGIDLPAAEMSGAAGHAADGLPIAALSNQNGSCHPILTMGRNSSTEAPEFQVTAYVSYVAQKR
jgi:hypothetical protein